MQPQLVRQGTRRLRVCHSTHPNLAGGDSAALKTAALRLNLNGVRKRDEFHRDAGRLAL